MGCCLPPARSPSILRRVRWWNLAAILDSAGTSWKNVVKTTVFLQDMRDFPTVNEVYARVVGDARPARSTVAVAGLPRGVLVEIEAVAIVDTK